MKRIILPCLLILSACSGISEDKPVTLKTSKTTPEKRTAPQKQFHWTGTINNKIPVFLNYAVLENVIAGEITYLNTKDKKPIKILGSIEEDKTYRLLEFEPSGNITGVLTGKPTAQSFTGNWSSPKTRKELSLNLQHKDTTIKPITIIPAGNDIAGNYRYQYSEKGYQGGVDIKKVSEKKIAFSISSVTSAPARNIAEVEKDTVELKGNSLIYTIPGSNNCEFKMTFYKGFLAVRYTKGYCTGQFGNNATIDGLFLKVK